MNALLLVHISAGTVGMVSGSVAMTARKGMRLHARAGTVFVASIIMMGVTGAAVAATRWLVSGHAYQVANFLMGLFTAYLAGTGWATARLGVTTVGWQDYSFLAIGVAVAGAFVAAGAGTAAGALWLQHGMGATFFFVAGSLAALAVAGDIRLLALKGVLGSSRLRRHLWRMCTAMLITVLSFFLGQERILPVWAVRTHINSVPVVATFIFLLFWLVKMRWRKALRVTAVTTIWSR